ncbi:MAG: glycosyltransferase [Bryobacterales bacterium]|nr:glycosyltransferase [Bryobacterales bacterium]
MQEKERENGTVVESNHGETPSKYIPRPTEVRYNNWRLVQMPPPESFLPCIPVSVIVPYYERPEELSRTLVSLERQSYPRDLFEVVVVDDGSRTPLERPEKSLLNIKVIHQDDRGYGLARARNNGVREASHDILLILDCDVLAEADWLAAHARWHHFVKDAVTIGFHYHVSIEGVDADRIRKWPGSLAELFAGRKVSPPWIERHMLRTNSLTSTADDIFRVVLGGNMGISREFYEMVGGFDESFTQWGGEDTEFGYRAFVNGGLLVPVRDAVGWHQGEWADGREDKERSIARLRGKLADQIAHPGFRRQVPGRSYKVPTYVITVMAMDAPVDRVVEAIERLLDDAVHDLVVFVDMPRVYEGSDVLGYQFASDPRVVVAASVTALELFPVAPIHISIPAAVSFERGVVRQLHNCLSDAVMGTARCDNGTAVSIAQTWVLHRINRTGREAKDFGEVVEFPANALGISAVPAPVDRSGRPEHMQRGARMSRLSTDLRRLRVELQKVRNPKQAWQLVRVVAFALRWRLAASRQSVERRTAQLAKSTPLPAPTKTLFEDDADYFLGVEVVALGERARAVFRACRHVAHATNGQHVDMIVADTVAESTAVNFPTVLLSEAPIQFSVPAFDPWIDNPINWASDADDVVAALGSRESLPPGSDVQRVIDRNDRTALKEIFRLEDVQAFHKDVLTRAGELARLAANGVVVRLADCDARLAEPLGAELFELMTRDSQTIDHGAREFLSIRMRRAALRDHSLRSRVQQIGGVALSEPPLPPLVSILLVTRRPAYLAQAIDAVARQTYPRLELVLGLHGDGFEACSRHIDRLNCPSTVLRFEESCPLGEALNGAVRASSGSLLSKMDDDDLYDTDHIWDLVLAHDYSRAALVGKGAEFVYLAASNRTIRRFSGGAETFRKTIAGGTLLIARSEMDRVGGWKPIPRSVDQALIEDVIGAGGRVYRTHGSGYVLVRHGDRHTWETDDGYFLKQADTQSDGWDPSLADFKDEVRPTASVA